MYTSGWPKNQNKCWYRIGSPPPDGSKNEVLKFRSVRSIVIAPASTGSESSNKIAVIITDQTNKGICSKLIDDGCILRIVEIKLIAPKMEEIPAKWREKIAISTDELEWNIIFERGG